MMGNIHKTDKVDRGLATLLYLGKLLSVWIPPATLRDERELPRTRMTFASHRTRVTPPRWPTGKMFPVEDAAFWAVRDRLVFEPLEVNRRRKPPQPGRRHSVDDKEY